MFAFQAYTLIFVMYTYEYGTLYQASGERANLLPAILSGATAAPGMMTYYVKNRERLRKEE